MKENENVGLKLNIQKTKIIQSHHLMASRWGNNENSERFILGGSKWQPTPVFLPGESHRLRSLIGCSPWGHEESDMSERLHFHVLEKAMATHFSVLAWRIPGMGSLVGCRLWGRTESGTTEAT